MKKIISYIALLMPVFFFSCIEEEEPTVKLDSSGQIEFTITSPEVKTSLDPSTLTVTWKQNDQLAIWSKGTASTTTLTAVSGGSSSLFTGEIGDLDTSKELYAVYPASAVQMQTSGYDGYTLVNHSQQSGLLSDFGLYNVSYTTALTKQFDGERLKVSYAKNPSNIFAVIKFKIKEGLDVRNITIEGLDAEGNSTNIAGNVEFNPSLPGIIATGEGNEIVISRGGELINGVVYVFISPNTPTSVISDENPLSNTATKLKFVFTNSSGQICDYTNLLSSSLKAGVLTDLGSINKIIFKDEGLYVVRGGEKWAQLSQKKDIVENSALDFSRFAVDAPAGKYGLLKAVDDHFEFEYMPGVSQYLYGANLTTSACAPEKSKAEQVATRMTRIGYNTVRLHHFDNLWQLDERDSNGDSYRDRMDYFIAKAKEKGLYIYIDLYSARKVKYSDIGLSGNSEMSSSEYEFLSLLASALSANSDAVSKGHAAAFDDWCNFTSSVLDRVNPYTGLTYAEDPAIIVVDVVNEPSFSGAWENGVPNLEPVKYAWKKHHGDILGSIFSASSQSVGSTMWDSFIAWIQKDGYDNMVKYCRNKGYNGILTVAYDSRCYLDSASGLSCFDIHDCHSYVDHPSGDIPQRTIDGEHPLAEFPNYVNAESSKYKDVYSKRPGVPHTLSEWNHCTPNSLRGLGAMYGSAYLRSFGWNAVWRFAYAQGAGNLFETTTPNSFDVAKDEVMKASEAGVVSFYLRGDISDPASQVVASDSDLSIVTDKSELLYREAMGVKTAGLLTADTRIYPATILITSMDGQSLASSGKILLANITDCAGNGATYSDDTKKVTVAYGTGQMLRISESDIQMKINNPEQCTVYELDTDGQRKSQLASSVVDGKLCFSISVRGTDGKAHIYYEISR